MDRIGCADSALFAGRLAMSQTPHTSNYPPTFSGRETMLKSNIPPQRPNQNKSKQIPKPNPNPSYLSSSIPRFPASPTVHHHLALRRIGESDARIWVRSRSEGRPIKHQTGWYVARCVMEGTDCTVLQQFDMIEMEVQNFRCELRCGIGGVM